MCVFHFLQDTNECLSEPCMNKGTCEDQPGSYFCHCPQGFKGHNCEIGTVGFSTICLENTVHLTNDIYIKEQILPTCKCLHAEEDGCESSPCLNGGTCRGFRLYYVCTCKDGFFGERCQMCK